MKRVCREHRSNLTWEDKNRERQPCFSEIFNIWSSLFVHISQMFFPGICDTTTYGMWFIVWSIVQLQRYRFNLIHIKFQELNKILKTCSKYLMWKVASTSWFGNFLSMAGVELSQLPHVLDLIPGLNRWLTYQNFHRISKIISGVQGRTGKEGQGVEA